MITRLDEVAAGEVLFDGFEPGVLVTLTMGTIWTDKSAWINTTEHVGIVVAIDDRRIRADSIYVLWNNELNWCRRSRLEVVC